MSITNLHEYIISEQGNRFSSPAGDTSGLLAESFDTFYRFNIYPAIRKAIFHAFEFDKTKYWFQIQRADLSFTEALQRGYARIRNKRQAYVLWDTIYMEMNEIAPTGYRFVIRDNYVGWLQARKEITLVQVLDWMHEQEPSKGYRDAVSNDALYLLDTIYEWKDRGIPVPYEYFELLQEIVNTHKEGVGL